jgi:hypothetical protein
VSFFSERRTVVGRRHHMSGGLLRGAAAFLTGGKYHWRAIPTALVGMNLLSPRGRTDPAFQQLSMFNGMTGMPQTGAVTAGGYNPNTGTGRPY